MGKWKVTPGRASRPARARAKPPVAKVPAPRMTRTDQIEAWRPAVEGVEGLRVRFGCGWREASFIAEGRLAAQGTPEAAWTRGRVESLSPAQLAGGLARRGVTTDLAAFATLAAGYYGARVLAEARWITPAHDVHDRDFLREAAYVLWTRWTPERFPDEAIEHELIRLDDFLMDHGGHETLGVLIEIWHKLEGQGGVGRMVAAGVALPFARLVADAGLDDLGAAEDTPAFAAALLRLMRAGARTAPAVERVLGDELLRLLAGPSAELDQF